MSHAHNHHAHDHDLAHGGDDHAAHDHSDDIEPAIQTLLYQQIEFHKIVTLNESVSNAGTTIVQKTWAERNHPQPLLASDADEQLLMTVPFAGTVKLHSILLRSSLSPSAPKTLKVFLNRDGLDFDTAASLTPVQTLELSRTADIQELPVKRVLFGNTYSLTLFWEESFGADIMEIFYLGFKGDFTRLRREPVEVLYEKAANPRDHQMIAGTGGLGVGGLKRGV